MERKEIRKIAVIGAGAIGSFFLCGLTHKDTEVWAVASGERKKRLEENGIIVNKTRQFVTVKTPEDSRGADLVIVCVKYQALPEVLSMLPGIVQPSTILLCPMNGVDTEEMIGQRIGTDHLLHSYMIIAAERSGNDIFYNDGVKPCVHYGRAQGYASEEDLQTAAELFARTGLNSKYKENIVAAMWNKFALNISTNIAQAVIGCNYGAYKTSRYMNELGQKLCDEVLLVAKARKVACDFDFQRALRTVGTNDTARFSTLQDLMAGRHTEADMFCGAIVRMGREYGVPTPFNEFAWLAIKALEEKNDGKIAL